MIQPDELRSEHPYGPWSSRGCDVWEAIGAAMTGDEAALRRLLERDPNIARYHHPIHFAAHEGHQGAVQLLLDAGADPDAEFHGDDPVTVARDRGHEAVAALLEASRTPHGRVRPADADHAIHVAAAAGDVAQVCALLDADPRLVHLIDRSGSTPLHRAVAASAREVVALLLDRGADIHALHGNGPRSDRGYAAVDFQPIDLALWTGPFWSVRGDVETARLLLSRGAAHDLVIAAALGDLESVRSILDGDPARIAEARPCGKRALSSAVEFGHPEVFKLLLDRGADPNAPEGANAPGDWRCTPPRASEIGTPWNSSSRPAPIPIATSIRRVTPPTSPGRPSCARSCSRRGAHSTHTTWCGWTRTMRRSAELPPTPLPRTSAAAVCWPPRPRGVSVTC